MRRRREVLPKIVWPEPPSCKHEQTRAIGSRNADGSPILFCPDCRKVGSQLTQKEGNNGLDRESPDAT